MTLGTGAPAASAAEETARSLALKLKHCTLVDLTVAVGDRIDWTDLVIDTEVDTELLLAALGVVQHQPRCA